MVDFNAENRFEWPLYVRTPLGELDPPETNTGPQLKA